MRRTAGAGLLLPGLRRAGVRRLLDFRSRDVDCLGPGGFRRPGVFLVTVRAPDGLLGKVLERSGRDSHADGHSLARFLAPDHDAAYTTDRRQSPPRLSWHAAVPCLEEGTSREVRLVQEQAI